MCRKDFESDASTCPKAKRAGGSQPARFVKPVGVDYASCVRRRRARARARRPPTAANSPGRPAPNSGPGTALIVAENETSDPSAPNCVVRLKRPGVGSKPVKVIVPAPVIDRSPAVGLFSVGVAKPVKEKDNKLLAV